MTTVEVSRRGPLFDGRAARAVDDYLERVKQDVAGQALSEVHRILNARIKHPTPYYEVQIRTHRRGDEWVADDRGIVYGPWLEGVGSRNSPRTSFPGYHAWAEAARTMNAGKAEEMADRILREYIGRMN